MISPAKQLPSIGCLDRVTIDDDRDELRIQGWAISLSGRPIEGFRVSLAGKELPDIEQVYGLDAPDVSKAHPTIAGAENSRFRIRVPLTKKQQQELRDALIAVMPLIQERVDGILFQILEPSLPIPNPDYISQIGGGFTEVALEFLAYFVQQASLQPTDSVLDVGCGVGRMAYALAYYLNPKGRYEGFDIVGDLVEWAAQSISPRFPNFQFRSVDMYNKRYNPHGTVLPAEFIFPYVNESFQFVFLTSVFTHLQGAEVCHYLEEIHRILKPGGRCLATCFLLQEESELLIAQGKSSQPLVYELKDCFTSNLLIPETAIGFRETLLLEWIGERGFTVLGKYYGSWCGRAGSIPPLQDFLILQKSL